jgi:hypothetical protein
MYEAIRTIPFGTPEYRRDYLNGWRVSERCAEGSLDRADARNVSHAWYDGYLDHATGREKWHIPNCPTHDTGTCTDATV